MLMQFALMGLAFAHDSEKDETVPTNDDLDIPDPCGSNPCNYYNDLASLDCRLKVDDMDAQSDIECSDPVWIDGQCGTDGDGCPVLEDVGDCLFLCWADDGTPDRNNFEVMLIKTNINFWPFWW